MSPELLDSVFKIHSPYIILSVSLKSLRFGSPISSELMIDKNDGDAGDKNQNEAVVSEPIGVSCTSPPPKPISEFACGSSKFVCLIFLVY